VPQWTCHWNTAAWTVGVAEHASLPTPAAAQAMDKLGLNMAVSRIATTMEECMKVSGLLVAGALRMVAWYLAQLQRQANLDPAAHMMAQGCLLLRCNRALTCLPNCPPAPALQAAEEIGRLPLIIRPAFTLGGTGGGIAYNMDEFA